MRTAEQCANCQTKDAPFQLSSHPNLCLNCYPKQDSIHKHEEGLSLEWNYYMFDKSKNENDPVYISKQNSTDFDEKSVGFSLTLAEMEWLQEKLPLFIKTIKEKESANEENSN